MKELDSTNTYVYAVYASDTRTNRDCFLPWTTTNTVGGVCRTNHHTPYLTYNIMTNLDARILSLPAGFARHWETNAEGLYTDWFLDTSSGSYPTEAPRSSFANILQHLGIGYVTNVATNLYGRITSSAAKFTRQPPTLNSYVLKESYFAGSDPWASRSFGLTADEDISAGALPVLRFYASTTNDWTAPGGITITGQRRVPPHTIGAQSIVVTPLSTNDFALTDLWYTVSSILVTNTAAHTGDTYAVGYYGLDVSYYDAPYHLYAEDVIERFRVINALRHTVYDTQGSGDSLHWYSGDEMSACYVWQELWEGSGAGSNAANARAAAEANWQDICGFAGSGVSLWYPHWYSTQEYACALNDYEAGLWAHSSVAVSESAYDTNYVHDVQFYVRATSVWDTVWTYDDNGAGYTEGAYSYVTNIVTDRARTNSVRQVGSVDMPTWSANPGPICKDKIGRGYMIERGPVLIVRWDIEDGLDFIKDDD